MRSRNRELVCDEIFDAWSAVEYVAVNISRYRTADPAIRLSHARKHFAFAGQRSGDVEPPTLVRTTSFRTADGEFHGFEGVNERLAAALGTARMFGTTKRRRPTCFPSLSRRSGRGLRLFDG